MEYHFSTLGYNQNPLIKKYQEQFLMKLKHIWKEKFGDTLPNNDFLLSPDIHSLLLSDAHDSLSIIREELRKYSIHEGALFNKDASLIPGTSIALTSEFYNPDAINDTHPDHIKDAIGITFGEKDYEQWKTTFARTFELLQNISPEFMNEISHLLKKIIPLGVSQKAHNSGSYSNAIGQIFMSYPSSHDTNPEYTLLEAILHEYNHNKLHLILQTEPLVLNDWQEQYYSPYRPDARHIHGIYLGLHALAGAYWIFWKAHRDSIIELPENWLKKGTLYVLKNGLSLQVLKKYARLSPIGISILQDMQEVHNECLAFIKQSAIPEKILKEAKEELIQHYQEVRGNYPNLLS